MKSVHEFKNKKLSREKITMVTCYDHWSAQLLKDTEVDCLLVGDSVSMVVHGHPSTVHADIEMMELHTNAVQRANTGKFIISDLPFLSHRKGKKTLMNHVDRLMKAGCHAIKMETYPGQEKDIQYMSESGVPIIGHVGLTPQHVNQLGGYKVQGKTQNAQQIILDHAMALQLAGCHALVVECVSNELAKKLTDSLEIPTVGIGAGLDVDGQVLVLQDLLGFNENFKPRFVRHFASGEPWLKQAVDSYVKSVRTKDFPALEESFQ